MRVLSFLCQAMSPSVMVDVSLPNPTGGHPHLKVLLPTPNREFRLDRDGWGGRASIGFGYDDC